MCGKFWGGMFDKGFIGGVEGVWEEWVLENDSEWMIIIVVEVVEYIFNFLSGIEF